jgi:hypothetical protein
MPSFNVSDAKKTPQIVIRNVRGDVLSVITPQDFQVGFEGNPGALILKGGLDVSANIINVVNTNTSNIRVVNDNIAYFIKNSVGLPINVKLPTPPANPGQTHIIKDYDGTANSVTPITISTADGSLIDEFVSMPITVPFGAIMFIWTGTGWVSLALGSSGAGAGASNLAKFITWDTETGLINSRKFTVTTGHLSETVLPSTVELGLPSIGTAGIFTPVASITTDGQGRVTAVGIGSTGADREASYIVMGLTSSLPFERQLAVGTGINLLDGGPNSSATLAIDDNIVATTSGSTFIGPVNFNGGLSGSLQRLTSNISYLTAGTNITIVTQSNGQVKITSTAAASSGADPGASFIVMGLTSSLANERALTGGTGIIITDGGANGNATVKINNNVVATISGSTFSGAVKFTNGLSGSLTQLVTGASYLVGGDHILVSSQSNGQVTIAVNGEVGGGDKYASYVVLGVTASLPNDRALTAGTGITIVDMGPGNNVIISAGVVTASNRLDQDSDDIIVWRLNEITGSEIINYGSSGSIANLTGTANILYNRAGIYDEALEFRGQFAPSYASSNNTVTPVETGFTVSSWIYPYRFPAGIIVAKNTTTGSLDAAASIILGITGAFGYPFAQVRTTGSPQNVLTLDVSRSIALYAWNHLGFTVNATDVKFYLNGDHVKSMNIIGNVDYANNGWWAVGGTPPLGTDSGDYKLNEIRIANTVRQDRWWKDIYTKGIRAQGISPPSIAPTPIYSLLMVAGNQQTNVALSSSKLSMGAAYFDPAVINAFVGTKTYMWRVISDVSDIPVAAAFDLYDVNGIISGIPGIITGSIMSSSNLTLTQVQVNLTSQFASVTGSGILEARLWRSSDMSISSTSSVSVRNARLDIHLS